MVFYTNYKQVAKLTLRSTDAVKESVADVIIGHPYGSPAEYVDTPTYTPGVNRVYQVIPGIVDSVVKNYTFSIQLPHMQFTKNTRLAVDTMSIFLPNRGNYETYVMSDVCDVYIKNLHRKNVYHSTPKSSNGTCILSLPLLPDVDIVNAHTYQNHDLINNSIDITNSTAFLQGQPLEIFVDAKMIKYRKTTTNSVPAGTRTTKFSIDDTIDGCPASFKWSLSLIVYEEEKEQNEKYYVDDRAKNFSIPKLY